MNPFLQVMKRLLGWPYSTCTSGPTASKPSYANACLQDKLYRKVWKECGCVPTRILSGLASGNFSQNRPCNFFDYGFCASKIVKNFHWSASEHCIRAVFYYNHFNYDKISQKNIFQIRTGKKTNKKLYSQCVSHHFHADGIQYFQSPSQNNWNKDVERTKVSLVIEFAEDTNILESETAAYPMSALLSDVGGAAGLVLGLNALGNELKILKLVI